MLKTNFLTKNLTEAELAKLACAMRPQTYFKKDTLIKYGDAGKLYFILIKGNVKVTVYKPGTAHDDPELEKKKLLTKYMGPGSWFGELALLYNHKRSSTIEAVDNCDVYTLEGQIFKTLIISSSIEKRSRKAEFLN